MLWNMLASMVRLENIPCQKRVVRECHVKEGLQILPLAFPTGLSVSAALLSSAHMAVPVWKDLLLGFGVSPGFRGLSPERGLPLLPATHKQLASLLLQKTVRHGHHGMSVLA